LEPRIAESWTPNADGSVWTFAIRQGVTFQDGTPLTADDVVATMELHTTPKNKSNALSAFAGVLSPGGGFFRHEESVLHCGDSGKRNQYPQHSIITHIARPSGDPAVILAFKQKNRRRASGGGVFQRGV
jgi:ABC-type transport system substrate-binding protein